MRTVGQAVILHEIATVHSNVSPEDRASLGISDGDMRLSVGLEDADDLNEDLDQALAFLCAG